jgi:hypothetical protein
LQFSQHDGDERRASPSFAHRKFATEPKIITPRRVVALEQGDNVDHWRNVGLGAMALSDDHHPGLGPVGPWAGRGDAPKLKLSNAGRRRRIDRAYP